MDAVWSRGLIASELVVLKLYVTLASALKSNIIAALFMETSRGKLLALVSVSAF